MQRGWWSALLDCIEHLNRANIDYTVIDEAALYAQNVPLPIPATIDIALQWDLFPRAYELFSNHNEIVQLPQYPPYHSFSVPYGPYTIVLRCYPNTVIVTDPARIQIKDHDTNQSIWVKALDAYRDSWPEDDPRLQAIKTYLRTLQHHNNLLNEQAWNQDTYEAWLHRHGAPAEVAPRLKKDPLLRLGNLSRYSTDYHGKRIINLLGSHGLKATALALLGAQVTIVDIAQGNARYACEVAEAADVNIRYIVSDVLALPEVERNASYDLVFMELGILHYFVDLEPLTKLISQLLRTGGRLILQDFHPISTKLITSKGKKHKVTGNYFDPTLITVPVAYSKHLPGEQQSASQQVYERQWTLGEIVTAVARSGLIIERLDEEPNTKIDDIGLPKTFTLLARKSAPS
jgi:SAM-dependent methyltransferase